MYNNPRSALRSIEAYPKQSLGQNFLCDPNILQKIVSAANLSPKDTAIEIGAGTGALSGYLAESGCDLHVIEIDQRFEPLLADLLQGYSNAKLHIGNAQELLPQLLSHTKGRTVVVGNLPYMISSQLVVAFLENRLEISRAVITVQLEMAKRLTAKPNSRDYGSLSVRIAATAAAKMLFKITPPCFFPPPKVHSGCLMIDFENPPPQKPLNENIFIRVIKGAFAQRRKNIKNALTAAFPGKNVALAIETVGLDPAKRAEHLDFIQYIDLADSFVSLEKKD